ncbi:MAG: hypothetical protein WC595_06555 [Candidatus Nanoarchaeia archaeon]
MAQARKALWLNDDGTEANVIYVPIDPTAAFSVQSFRQNFEHVDSLKNATKAQYSQAIFGTNTLESASDRDFNSFKKNFNRDNVQEALNDYIVNKSPQLITTLTMIDPEQTERFLLHKNRNAKTSAFRIEQTPNTPEDKVQLIQAYNGVVDAKIAYHAEIERMDLIGDQAYVTGRLNNLTPMQIAVIMAATGSRPGDFTKIARSYKDFHAANVLERINAFGIESYVANNFNQARTLELNHKASLRNLETVVEEKIAELGIGAPREKIKEVYKKAETQKEALAVTYQNAESDARSLYSELANKTYEEVARVTRYQAAAQPARQAA